jgi:hypothetical protein
MGCGKRKSGAGSREDNCVCTAVRAIKDLQDNAVDECVECETDCFLSPLGAVSPINNRPNTRIFKLYTKNGDVFKVKKGYYKLPFFRVKDVFDNCCATLQLVKPDWTPGDNEDDDADGLSNFSGFEWKLTDICITVDLECFCAIQCVADVHVDLDCDED